MLLYEVVHEILFDLKPCNLYLCIHTCSGYSIVKSVSVSYNVFNSIRQMTAFHALQTWLVIRFANLGGLAKQLLNITSLHMYFLLVIIIIRQKKRSSREACTHVWRVVRGT